MRERRAGARDPLCKAHRKPIPPRHGYQRPVRDHDALWYSGRARGVDDVCEIFRHDLRVHRKVSIFPIIFLLSVGINGNDAPVVTGETLPERFAGDHRRCTGVRKDECDPFLGECGIDGNVRTAGLQDAESTYGQSDAAISQQSYGCVRLYAVQTCDELIRLMVQLRIGEPFIIRSRATASGVRLA